MLLKITTAASSNPDIQDFKRHIISKQVIWLWEERWEKGSRECIEKYGWSDEAMSMSILKMNLFLNVWLWHWRLLPHMREKNLFLISFLRKTFSCLFHFSAAWTFTSLWIRCCHRNKSYSQSYCSPDQSEHVQNFFTTFSLSARWDWAMCSAFPPFFKRKEKNMGQDGGKESKSLIIDSVVFKMRKLRRTSRWNTSPDVRSSRVINRSLGWNMSPCSTS